MKYAVLVPARSGSRRVPDKNVRELGGKPLMAYSIQTGLDLGYPVYVSTDSVVYAATAASLGASFVRRENADENQTDFDVVRHFLDRVDCEVVIYLRPTTPFRTVSMVQEAVKNFFGTGLRSVEEMAESAYKCFRVVDGRLWPVTCAISEEADDYTDNPNHLCPKTYHPNGYVDLIRSEFVSSGSLWGIDKQAFITPRTIEIDTEEDFEYAQWWANRHPEVKYRVGNREVDRDKGFSERP